MRDTARPYTQSRLATYLQCPRLFEYTYVQDVRTPDRTERYLIQGNVFHGTVERVCGSVDGDTAAASIHDLAMATFPAVWASEVDPGEFKSRAQQEYYRRQCAAALEEYFDPESGRGVEHARQSVAVEEWLETTVAGIPVAGYVDNVLLTDAGPHILDYKRSRGTIVSSGTADRLAGHLDGEAYEPGRVKSAIQAALYTAAVRDSAFCEPGDDVRFSYYVYLYDDTFEPAGEGYTVSARGKQYEMTDIVRDHEDTIWALIDAAADGIRGEAYEPEPWAFILDKTCADCEYRRMCPDYLTTEVERL